MMNYRSPGLYVREIEAQVVLPQQNTVPVFVGFAQRGPVDSPQPIVNWGQFVDIFGDFLPQSYLAYSVFGFFENGGQYCYVVRVADETADAASLVIFDQHDHAIIKIRAINEGKWGRDLVVNVQAHSTDNIILSELTSPFYEDDIEAAVSTVSGLIENDQVVLVNRQNPLMQKRLTIAEIKYGERKLIFAPESPVDLRENFPVGSQILGKGFRLTLQYKSHQEVYDNLSLNQSHDRYFIRVINGDPIEPHYVRKSLSGQSTLVFAQDLCSDFSSPGYRPCTMEERLENGTDSEVTIEQKYFTGYANSVYFNSPGREGLKGLAASELVSEVNLVCIPDLVLVTGGEGAATHLELIEGQCEILQHCEKMGTRFAILDVLPHYSSEEIKVWSDNLSQLPSAKNGALYYPWIKVNPTQSGLEKCVPACGHIAGVYARSDLQRGVHKAPANEILNGAQNLETSLSDEQQGELNPLGINCLRVFPGRGIRIWGARTLSSDLRWRYINIRRVCLSIKYNILKMLQWSVFEPNTPQLWQQITSSLTSYLNSLFSKGMLAGSVASESFYVKCDSDTNPANGVNVGQVVAEVGFVIGEPAEFIVVTIRRSAESLSVAENMG